MKKHERRNPPFVDPNPDHVKRARLATDALCCHRIASRVKMRQPEAGVVPGMGPGETSERNQPGIANAVNGWRIDVPYQVEIKDVRFPCVQELGRLRNPGASESPLR
jgi:hypothetical protein